MPLPSSLLADEQALYASLTTRMNQVMGSAASDGVTFTAPEYRTLAAERARCARRIQRLTAQPGANPMFADVQIGGVGRAFDGPGGNGSFPVGP